MHSVCCIHGQVHGQISLLASKVSKKAVAAPLWSSASSLFWKLPLPKLCFYLWSSVYCLSTEMLLSMPLVKAKQTKVMKITTAMSAVSCDDSTRLRSGDCFKQQFLKQLGNPELNDFSPFFSTFFFTTWQSVFTDYISCQYCLAWLWNGLKT